MICAESLWQVVYLRNCDRSNEELNYQLEMTVQENVVFGRGCADYCNFSIENMF